MFEKLKNYLGLITTIFTILGTVAAIFLWADNNLASKEDITVAITTSDLATNTEVEDAISSAKKYNEFRLIELQLTLNDYIINEMEKEGNLDEPTRERTYNAILSRSEELEKDRQRLIISGALND